MLDPKNLDLLARSVRLLSKTGAWEGAASLAAELNDVNMLVAASTGSARGELALVLQEIGRHARRCGRPLAGLSAGGWCSLAKRLVEASTDPTEVSPEIRHDVEYWAAATALDETSDVGLAESATATLESLLDRYPVVDERTAIDRAHHLSRLGRAHQRCAELTVAPGAALATLTCAMQRHAEAEALLDRIGWTASLDFSVLLQRRAITLRALAWAQFSQDRLWPQDLMTGALALLQRSTAVLRDQGGVHMRDERHILRQIALSLIDCGRFEEAISTARSMVPEAERQAASGVVIDAMFATQVTACMAQAVHARCVRLQPADPASIADQLDLIRRRTTEGASEQLRVALDFDVAVLHLMRSSDLHLHRQFRDRRIWDALRSRWESVCRVAGPNSPETLFRSSVLGTLEDPRSTKSLFTGVDHEP